MCDPTCPKHECLCSRSAEGGPAEGVSNGKKVGLVQSGPSQWFVVHERHSGTIDGIEHVQLQATPGVRSLNF